MANQYHHCDHQSTAFLNVFINITVVTFLRTVLWFAHISFGMSVVISWTPAPLFEIPYSNFYPSFAMSFVRNKPSFFGMTFDIPVTFIFVFRNPFVIRSIRDPLFGIFFDIPVTLIPYFGMPFVIPWTPVLRSLQNALCHFINPCPFLVLLLNDHCHPRSCFFYICKFCICSYTSPSIYDASVHNQTIFLWQWLSPSHSQQVVNCKAQNCYDLIRFAGVGDCTM